MKVRVGCEREEELGRGAYEEDGSADPDDGHHRYHHANRRNRISRVYRAKFSRSARRLTWYDLSRITGAPQHTKRERENDKPSATPSPKYLSID